MEFPVLEQQRRGGEGKRCSIHEQQQAQDPEGFGIHTSPPGKSERRRHDPVKGRAARVMVLAWS
jgi:hypothetical protein